MTPQAAAQGTLETGTDGSGPPKGGRPLRPRPGGRDGTLRVIVTVSAASAVVAMLAIFVFLLLNGLPSIRFSGLSFVTSLQWNLGNLYSSQFVHRNGSMAPVGATYGILPFIFGTLATSAIALLIAVPVSIGSALLITEYLPDRAALPISFLIELLAGVPSVVFGLWGLVVVVPWIANALGPFVGRILGFIPFFQAGGSGMGLLAAGLVLAIMVIPIITATARDVLVQAPADVKAGAEALGLTKWETIRAVSLPWARTGILGAAILGLGRALGETMAVLMISGNAIGTLPATITSPISTMAAVIVAQLDSALTDPTGMALHALAEIALILFFIAVAVNIPARILVTRQLQAGGPGA